MLRKEAGLMCTDRVLSITMFKGSYIQSQPRQQLQQLPCNSDGTVLSHPVLPLRFWLTAYLFTCLITCLIAFLHGLPISTSCKHDQTWCKGVFHLLFCMPHHSSLQYQSESLVCAISQKIQFHMIQDIHEIIFLSRN